MESITWSLSDFDNHLAKLRNEARIMAHYSHSFRGPGGSGPSLESVWIEEPIQDIFLASQHEQTSNQRQRGSMQTSNYFPVNKGAFPSLHHNPIVFPDPKQKHLVRTYASVLEKNEVRLMNTGNPWVYTLPVPIPSELTNPTLMSLVFLINYSSTNTGGSVVAQTDCVLTTKQCPTGLLRNSDELPIYRKQPNVYGPKMLDDDDTMRLWSSYEGKFKHSVSTSYSSYIDEQCLQMDVRVLSKEARLYLNFHISERGGSYQTLAMEVSASWLDGTSAKRGREEQEGANSGTTMAERRGAGQGISDAENTVGEEWGFL